MKLIRVFIDHRLAANLGMVLMVVAGIWALTRLSVQLNPDRPLPYVNAQIGWRGATAEDVEKLVTTPLEQHLKTIPDVRSVTRDASVFVRMELEADADPRATVDRVKQRIARIRSFPQGVETPSVYTLRQRDLVAAVLVTGGGSLEELVPLARRMEDELLGRGIDAVQLSGLPTEEIAIAVESRTLRALGLTFADLGAQLAALSSDAPGGTIGAGDFSRVLRSLDQRRAAAEFEALPVATPAGTLVRLGDIATVQRRRLVDQPYLTVGGKPAIALHVRRDQASDSLDAARNLHDYLAAKRPTLPDGVAVGVFLEAWAFIRDELRLIVGNGLGGLVFVVVALVVFLRVMPAFWVTVGIPVTFMASLLGFHYLGGTINVVSLIGFIMALGIVVDDAIVVGEESLTQFEAGKSPAAAAAAGATRMFAPVVASSLTTLCAFTPLVASDEAALKEIAIVMLVVIAASLVECFLILPGHLRHAFEHTPPKAPSRLRARFNAAFERFRERRFRRLVRHAMANRGLVFCAALGLFVVMLTVWQAGWLKTDMNLNVDFDEIRADVRFTPGAGEDAKQAFLANLEEALGATDANGGGGNLVNHVVQRNVATINNESKRGPQFASIRAELVSPEKRDLSADEFAAAWRRDVERAPFVDALVIARERSWSSDFSILLKGTDAAALKRAADELISELATLDGVSNLRDNLPWGKAQWLLSLTPAGRSLGLSAAELGRQLRAAYDGHRIQIFQDRENEMEVRLTLPETERSDPSRLGSFPVKTPEGEMLPLAAVANIEARRGIDAIRHHNTERTLTVRGDVDFDVISGAEVVAHFNKHIRAGLGEKHGVYTGLDERSLAQREATSALAIQFPVALALIYLVLAWIFASWSWPLAVMAAIPLGLTGALLGHVLLGLRINPMSILGLFTLTGVIVNDAIILVTTYKRLLAAGAPAGRAIEDAVCRRLRPVLLTSLTTMAGLFPLMLEQAPIGAMFKPLAAAICFGLLYGTLLVLVVIPVLLSLLTTANAKLADARARWAGALRNAPPKRRTSRFQDAQGAAP